MTTVKCEDDAVQVAAYAFCMLQGIQPVDKIDGSPNWWMFREPAQNIVNITFEAAARIAEKPSAMYGGKIPDKRAEMIAGALRSQMRETE